MCQINRGMFCILFTYPFDLTILPANILRHVYTTGHIPYQGVDSGPSWRTPGIDDSVHLSRIQFHIHNVDILHQKCLPVSNISDPVPDI